MNFANMIYGGDYNPDQWPVETWEEDARLMREAGVNLVSLGIFSWTRLEPRPGIFDFDWLDHLMDLLHEHGIHVNLATPTAAPPAWLVREHPEILPVTADGTTLWHGSRRHYCPHSPAYHEHVVRLVRKLAERYAQHPALAMWHVDNEYACHVTECFCDASVAAFRRWLAEKYGSIDALNDAWGTAFWSQTYGDWDEIHPPRVAPTFINPTQQLDWARFSSDSWIACFDEQKAILRELTPGVPITTNFMGFHKPIDYWKFAAQEDVVANDNYPDMSDPSWMVYSGMVCDLMRSLGNSRPWILMEQAPAHVNWRQRNVTKRPGVMRLCSYQAVARGADGIMFFQWRASRAGAEKFHSAMVPHVGTDSRVWREVKHLGAELRQLEAITSSQVSAEVAILIDWESWWALELPGKPSNDLRLLPHILAYYTPLFQRNITVDFAHPASDLSRYKLVFAPTLYLVNGRAVENLHRYVREGGNLVMSYFSGIVNEHDHVYLGGYPAPFREMLGLVVEEHIPFAQSETNTFCTSEQGPFGCTLWGELIHLQGAQTLATFEQDYYAGHPAVTANSYGKGKAFYVGTLPDPNGMEWLTAAVCSAAGVEPVWKQALPGVEIVRRANGSSSWLFALNHSGQEVTIPLEQPGYEVLSQTTLEGSLQLGPTQVAIVRQENPS
jgi:beta-galactosidase